MDIVIWFIAGIVLLSLLAGGKGKNKNTGTQKHDPVRIHHPHYMTDDEYECSACKARFRNDTMTCPSCGAHFSRIREDDGEFIEEMELYDGDEEDE